ncbi:MAG: hypothetical protein FJX53_08430 [Alphaproteobacteria bacterium]|nr:hypothetical protein [Alphaproteobacteria bacterium]
MSKPSAYDQMIFIMYSPVDDAEARGYSQWLVDVDNPYFNRADGVARYTNWRVTGPSSGAPFGYFDFLGMTGNNALFDVWESDKLSAFRHEWRVLWGRDRSLSAEGNSHAVLCRRQSAAQRETPFVAVALHGAASPPPPGYERWSVEKVLRGRSTFSFLDLRYLSDRTALDTAAQPKGSGASAFVGELIAAPPG